MKKAITTILSALLLISCLTVNVFAEGEEQNTQEETTIQENIVTDQDGTDNTNQTNESVTSKESNDDNTRRQTATNASVTVDDMTVSLIRYENGLWNFDFNDDNAFNVYQAIAFENRHFIVNYDGSELHGNCNDDSHNQIKLEPAIIDGLYQYITTDDSGNSVFSIVIDYGVNTSLSDVIASININDIDYGFEKIEGCNLFVFTLGNNPVPPEDFNPQNSVINITVPDSNPLDCYLSGSGPYEGYFVEFYTIVWFETSNGFEHACFAMGFSENSGGGDNQENDISSSFIMPQYDSNRYHCNNNNNTEFSWMFNVDVDQLYNGQNIVLFFTNNTSDSIQFKQTVDSINQIGEVKIENLDGGFNIYAPLNNEVRFEAKKGDSIQNHIIRFDCDYEEVRSKTSIENLDFNNGYWFNLYDSTYNNSKQMFDLISIGAQIDSNSFKSLVSEIQQGSNVNLDSYYTFTLKEGYSIAGKPICEISTSNRGKMIKVIYNVTDGTNSSQIVLNIERNFNQGDMSQVFVDNKEFYLDDVVDSTKVYISNSRGAYLDFDVQEIVNAVNSESVKHGAIFVDYECKYVRDDNSGYPENISDGYEVEPSWYVGLNLYYLDKPELLNSSHLNSESLSRVENFNNTINTKLEYSNFENYSGAYEHRLKTELKLPYSVNGGALLFPTIGQGNLNQNSDAIVWLTHEVREESNRIIFYRNMSFSKPASVIHYDIFSEQDENYNPSRVIFIGGENNSDYPATSEGLVKAINELRHSGKSAVVLKEDITLNRDAYIKHVTVERNEDPYSALHDIEINLNGHNINANGYSLINLRTSTIHITNYVVDENGRSTGVLNSTAKITGSNANPAIINYGGLYVLSNITVENKQGTGIVTYNSGDLFLTNGTKIDAAICVDIRENEMFSDGRNSANIDIRGELNASYIAIQSTTVESDVVNYINLYSGSVDNSVQRVMITSSNIGVRTIGNVNINVYGCDIYADSPLVMSGGTIEVRHANFSSTNGKPVILVDSNNVNATDTTILIAAEANVCMSTSGTLIKEISSTTESKIKSIYFYSINPKDESYFDYANGKLFELSAAPSSNSILINGGCFSDQSYQKYLQGAVLDEHTLYMNNKTYYYNLKKRNIDVSTFQELKSALENSAVDSVRLSNDISAATGSVISFKVNGPKVLFTNGFTIENVKFEPVTTIQGAPKAFFTIDGEGIDNGKLINEGVVIESSVDQIFIKYIDIESTGDVAIKINRGEFFAQNNLVSRTIKGAKAIEVNVGNANNTIGDININNYNLTGIAGPAIDVVKTNSFSYLGLNACNVSTILDDNTSDSSAIRVNDRTRIGANDNSSIIGTRYGVYFTDTLPDTGFVNNYAGMQFGNKTEVKADVAFRLGNYTVVHFDDVYAEAKTTVMEIHGFTQYVIASGEYSVSEGNDVISFVGINPEDNYNWHRITGGYYSHEIPDNEIFNAPNYKYLYDCLPVSLSNNPLPWVVARKQIDQNNYQYIEVPRGRDVEIDGSKLDSAYDEKETDGYNSFDVVLTVKYKNDQSTKDKFDGHGNGFKEYYDIHVDKIVDNKATDNNDSTKNYQLITIPLNEVSLEGQNIIYAKIDNVKVYHKHGNSDPVVLKKINKDKAVDANEECYYLEEINGNWYLNIITRQFSDFAIAEDENAVSIQELKPNYVLTLQYNDAYSKGNFIEPNYAVYGDNKTISADDVDIVYYNAEGTSYYYGTNPPDETGNYIAEWVVKEGKNITGSGTKQFTLIKENLSLVKIKNNLVYTGSDIELLENIEGINNYRFELLDSSNNKTVFEGEMPTAVNAGTYKLWYSKNGITQYIGDIVIDKAKPSENVLDGLTATYNTKLSNIEISGGWYWVNPDYIFDSVGDVIVKAKHNGNENYLALERDVTIKVSPMKAPRPQLPTIATAVYRTKLGDIELTGTWKWVDESIIPTVNNDGYEAYIKVDDVHYDWSNYTEYNSTKHTYTVVLKPVISKADPDNIPSDLTAVYGDKLSDISLSNGWKWLEPDKVITEIGELSFKAKVEESDNYLGAEKDLTVIVSKKQAIVPEVPTAEAVVYGVTLKDVKLSDSNWKWVDESIKPTVTNNDYQAYIVVDDTHYNWDGIDGYDSENHRYIANISVSVSKASPEYAAPKDLTAIYGDTLSVISLPTGWSWKDKTLSVGNATTTGNMFEAIYTPDDTSNYNKVTVELNVIVKKANPKYTLLEHISATYGDKLDDVKLPDNWSWVDKTQSVGDATAEGRKFEAKFTPNDINNYNEVIVNLDVVVNKANPKFETSTNLTATYNDKISKFELSGGWYWENKDLVFNEIGEVKVTAKFDATDNYNASSKEVTVTVNKKQATIPAKPTAEAVVYGVTLKDVKLSDSNWKWVDESIKPTVTNNDYQAYIVVDDTHYNWDGIDGYDSENHRYATTVLVNVSKAEQDITEVAIPVIKDIEKGVLLENIELPVNWRWENPRNSVSDSNYAVYNPDKANYVDLLVSIPVYIKETVAGKDVNISNTVSSSDEKGIEEVTISNDGISKSVVDAVANTSKSDTKVTGEAAELINKAGTNSSLSISTEFVKETVNDETKKQEAIEKANVKSDEVAMVLDLEIKITVNDGTATKTGNITELAEPVKLTFKLPEGSKVTASEGKELKYYVLIIHEGEVHKVPAVLNADGTVTFEADKFSTYILVSEEVAKPAENNKPNYVPSQDKKPVVNTSAK